MYYKQIPPCMMWYQSQMMNVEMPEADDDDDDEDIKKLYPKIYFKVMPMIKHHCDKMEGKYGTMYCPSEDELEKICEDIREKLEKDHEGTDIKDNDCNNKGKRRNEEDAKERQFGIRPLIRDLAGILLLGEVGRRRRRRRRPNHGYGGYGGYGY